MDIAELLAFSVKNSASDLHLSAELPPMIRVDGDVRRINVPPLDNKTVQNMLYDIMNDKQRKDFEEFLETDFSFEIPGLARFRVKPASVSISSITTAAWAACFVPFPRPSFRSRSCAAPRSSSAFRIIRVASCW